MKILLIIDDNIFTFVSTCVLLVWKKNDLDKVQNSKDYISKQDNKIEIFLFCLKYEKKNMSPVIKMKNKK